MPPFPEAREEFVSINNVTVSREAVAKLEEQRAYFENLQKSEQDQDRKQKITLGLRALTKLKNNLKPGDTEVHLDILTSEEQRAFLVLQAIADSLVSGGGHGGVVRIEVTEELTREAAEAFATRILPTQFDVAEKIGGTPMEFTAGAKEFMGYAARHKTGMDKFFKCLENLHEEGGSLTVKDQKVFDALLIEWVGKEEFNKWDAEMREQRRQELVFLVGFLKKHEAAIRRNVEYSDKELPKITLAEALAPIIENAQRVTGILWEWRRETLKTFSVRKLVRNPDINFDAFTKATETSGKNARYAAKEAVYHVFSASSREKKRYRELTQAQREQFDRDFRAVQTFFLQGSANIRLANLESAIPDEWLKPDRDTLRDDMKSAYTLVLEIRKHVQSPEMQERMCQLLLIPPKENRLPESKESAAAAAVHDLLGNGKISLADAYQLFLMDRGDAGGKFLGTFKMLALLREHKKMEEYSDRMFTLGETCVAAVADPRILQKIPNMPEELKTELTNAGKYLSVGFWEHVGEHLVMYKEGWERHPFFMAIGHYFLWRIGRWAVALRRRLQVETMSRAIRRSESGDLIPPRNLPPDVTVQDVVDCVERFRASQDTGGGFWHTWRLDGTRRRIGAAIARDLENGHLSESSLRYIRSFKKGGVTEVMKVADLEPRLQALNRRARQTHEQLQRIPTDENVLRARTEHEEELRQIQEDARALGLEVRGGLGMENVTITGSPLTSRIRPPLSDEELVRLGIGQNPHNHSVVLEMIVRLDLNPALDTSWRTAIDAIRANAEQNARLIGR